MYVMNVYMVDGGKRNKKEGGMNEWRGDKQCISM